MRLTELGWTPERESAFAPHAAEGLVPGRVVVEHKNAYVLYVDQGELRAGLAGRVRRSIGGNALRPSVGDWVGVRPPVGDGIGVIHVVLPRTSVFVRQAAGRGAEEQVVAANVDVVLLVVALTEPPNTRRLQRYLTVAWDSGAQPVVVLSKSDIALDATARQHELETACPGVPFHRTSAFTGDGLDAVRAYLGPGRTLALLGPSGVGKSRLVNALLGEDRLRTGAVRPFDGKGRHTTTRRELIPVPGGGLLLDTPGMRELQLWGADGGLAETFGEIAVLAADCRFRDCTHMSEPQCAVRAAAEAGQLAPERLASFQKLQAELGALEARVDPAARRVKRQEARAAGKALKARLKRKYD